jgi:ectoine hydroxylase-related dioxygenase (phytanoyl-CoA dioxygenase family)
MIAVAARAEATGYSGWSVKAGVLHVQPPVSVLEGMLTVRIHLDDAGPSNAALRVLPGSHRLGGADPTEIEPWRERVEPVTCSARAGDALVMRPLLIHASSPSTTPSRRRVVHLEYAAGGLPGGVEWHESARRIAVGRP